MTHVEWFATGEAFLARGYLRRALSAFRKSQRVDLRGENAFRVHNVINAVTSILLQQRKFFLHVHDDAALFERPGSIAPLTDVDLGVAEIDACLRAQTLLTEYADRSFTLELEPSQREAWLDALGHLYQDLVNREEPET